MTKENIRKGENQDCGHYNQNGFLILTLPRHEKYKNTVEVEVVVMILLKDDDNNEMIRRLNCLQIDRGSIASTTTTMMMIMMIVSRLHCYECVNSRFKRNGKKCLNVSLETASWLKSHEVEEERKTRKKTFSKSF